MKGNLIEQCCTILSKTNDGDDLSSQDLKFIENAVNFGLNESGENYLKNLLKQCEEKTYKKPYHLGVEHMTQDHEGYIYYKGIHVEHYSFTDIEREKAALIELKSRCEILEQKKIAINSLNAIWLWGKHDFQKMESLN